MKLVAGLGNPGARVPGHAAQRRASRSIDLLAAAARAGVRGGAGRRAAGAVAPGRRRGAAGQAAHVHEPERRGGRRRCAGSTRSTLPDLLIVCDDVNLPLGRLRARASGSEGGHNGLRSVAERLGTIDYARLRIGVGRGDARRDLADHVLARFEPDELPGIEAAVARAADAVETWVADGLAQMMNTFNRARRQRHDTLLLAAFSEEGGLMSIRRHMSTVRQYELVYIAPPETTEEALAELHTQVAAVVERFGGNIEKTENWGRRKLAYEIAGQREGVYVLEVINGPARADGRARSPPARVRHRHPPHGRAGRRGTGRGRARARRAARRAMAARRVRRGLPPEPTETGTQPAPGRR